MYKYSPFRAERYSCTRIVYFEYDVQKKLLRKSKPINVSIRHLHGENFLGKFSIEI